jgi:UDPglucose--hexose-1-phosphate uridylyltransferase
MGIINLMEDTHNFDYPHRRLNPLTREWVLVSPHRARRPWLGQVEKIPPEELPAYDPTCYLCPGNQRAGDHKNPAYTSTFVFDNDFPALLADLPEDANHDSRGLSKGDQLFTSTPETGVCRVVCFSPRHDLSLPELSQEEVEAVVRTWKEQTEQLGKSERVCYVQIFENKGALMGCSNPHPHSQIWATSQIPNEPLKEGENQRQYLQTHGTCLLCDYLAEEKRRGSRLVVENDHFTALVPYWAVWPFELLLLSNRHLPAMPDLTDEQIAAMADILRKITTCYENLFEISFPYSMGFHQSPVDGNRHPEWHFHAHYYPPLLRSATVRKFMVGYEMLGMPQRDITPETAAERLRSIDKVHYRFR